MHLALQSVAANYGPRHVIYDLSLDLQQGEILVVSGRNGSGKSTLLRLLCGLQQPSSGQIRYTHQERAYTPQAARHLLGWVSPDLMLYRELTASENLHFFARVRGLPWSTADSAALLDRVELAGRGHDLVSSYSSGMTQRLRYAYALQGQPLVLLLDEPTVTLDEQGMALVHRIIEQQRQHGPVVVATNDPRELALGDYVLQLQPPR
ncbi:MAG: ABC transporter ATP-binding protein [Chloroflexaceae bacterium]|nr:ABC transporter ATP-binding protein [Chloroflexaceae bacterium]